MNELANALYNYDPDIQVSVPPTFVAETLKRGI